MADLTVLQQRLGVTFNDPLLLEQALVHRSFHHENPVFPLPSNERLEFLGDAVLDSVIAERLFRHFPYLSEGKLTKLRAGLVCQDTLAKLSASLNLGDYLHMGSGEEASGGRQRARNMARALEALFGAVFLDQGFAVARDFILSLFDALLKELSPEKPSTDYKSLLQELVQAQGQPTPSYRTVEIAGPEHARHFTVEVLVADRVLGRGSGISKRTAETEAARTAMKGLTP